MNIKLCTIFTILCLVWFGGYMQRDLSHSCPPPTIPRVQQMLLDEGYDLGESGADGGCGEKTAIAWTWWSEYQVERENAAKCK